VRISLYSFAQLQTGKEFFTRRPSLCTVGKTIDTAHRCILRKCIVTQAALRLNGFRDSLEILPNNRSQMCVDCILRRVSFLYCKVAIWAQAIVMVLRVLAAWISCNRRGGLLVLSALLHTGRPTSSRCCAPSSPGSSSSLVPPLSAPTTANRIVRTGLSSRLASDCWNFGCCPSSLAGCGLHQFSRHIPRCFCCWFGAGGIC
jgi:hypothetical protein